MPKAKKIKVKITGAVSASPWLLPYHIGKVVEIEEKKATALIEAGVAEFANAQKSTAKNCDEILATATGALNAKIAELEETNAELSKDKEALIKANAELQAKVEAFEKEKATVKATAKAGKPKS